MQPKEDLHDIPKDIQLPHRPNTLPPKPKTSKSTLVVAAALVVLLIVIAVVS